ncbi:hypothetical protein H072_8056 [Dactylellina haptotyla CBS 200.50]|uniref:Uncharacterized protein n=1 Tax=Dactylellina haptotyla (strain CBS 200.50) TaxID=1284197 RepID=S8BFV9_DACHA|nr:hypothetical protein H072_8056 [Dactylellina haptotyla CBS 200.50]
MGTELKENQPFQLACSLETGSFPAMSDDVVVKRNMFTKSLEADWIRNLGGTRQIKELVKTERAHGVLSSRGLRISQTCSMGSVFFEDTCIRQLGIGWLRLPWGN